MALIDDLISRLASVETGVVRACGLAADGEASARVTAERMAASGFAGIARSVDGVQEAFCDLVAALNALRGRIVAMQRTVAAVPGHVLPARVVAVLEPLARETTEISADVGGCLVRVGELARRTGRALQGGQPGPMLAGLSAIGQIIAVVRDHATAVGDGIDAALDEARGSGRTGTAPIGETGRPAGTAGPPDLDERAPYRSGCLERLPVRLRDDAPTHGVLTTTDGAMEWEVRSGQRGPATGAPGLRPPFDKYVSALDHAESHAAAIIRKRRLTEATLYLNNPPCDTPLGCDRVLPYILRAGAKLTVYGPGGYRKVYHGNGKGLA
jgi:hypothetical protein